MGVLKGKSEGGSGGKRGHSNMDHWGDKVPVSGTPIELAYQIQDNQMRREPLNATSKHYVFSVRLLSERYVIFHVPLKYFREGMHIVVPFNYDWELDANGIMRGGFHVFHQAKFFNKELSQALSANGR